MCRKQICQRTITKIELDVVELREELRKTPINYDNRREQLKKSIIYAEEIIEDLEQREAQS